MRYLQSFQRNFAVLQCGFGFSLSKSSFYGGQNGKYETKSKNVSRWSLTLNSLPLSAAAAESRTPRWFSAVRRRCCCDRRRRRPSRLLYCHAVPCPFFERFLSLWRFSRMLRTCCVRLTRLRGKILRRGVFRILAAGGGGRCIVFR